PFIICDPRTIDTGDLIAVDRVTPDFTVEMYYRRFNPEQKWHWLRKQATDELTAFVNYDTDITAVTMCLPILLACPHAVFENREAPSNAPIRSSIEVRLTIFILTDQVE
ncbi:hypothetical protein P154DRAFT_440424, partial [Amniculicola lignicola CBS 123094]